MTGANRPPTDKPWGMPLAALALAVVVAAIAWFGTGDLVLASMVGAVMVVYAVILRVGSRSESVRILRGETEDERNAAIEARASVISLHAVIVVALIGAGIELWRGAPGPFTLICFVGGVTYTVALPILHRRM